MKYGFTRLTLFALLSSIEEDLRELIIEFISGNPSSVFDSELLNKLTIRYSNDNQAPMNELKVNDLIIYADFQESLELLNKHKRPLPEYIIDILKKYSPELLKLTPIRNRVAHTRPLNHDDFTIVNDVALTLIDKCSKDLWSNLNNTITRLKCEPSFVLGLEIPSYFLKDEIVFNNLPLPDFDETGFIGRNSTIENIKRLCLGPYPVISIVGDGGQGKTAITVKVAYEILEMEECPFDAIIWSTSKTTQLTNNEIREIDGAISTSIGVFKDIESNLYENDNEDENPIDTVIDYLSNIKILLIIDNLETVLDDRIRNFLERLPSGSKVLFTSRIGLGAFEYPVKLEPMDSKDSINLLRCLANIRGLKGLVKTDNNILKKYCDKMNNNPGYIKWFISAVQAGKRPEQVLDKPDLFLDFCMSNVYEYLDQVSRKILISLLCIHGELSNAELSYLNELDYISLQKGLHQLISTNMVHMRSTPRGSSFETKYDITDFARQYLLNKHPASTTEYKKIKSRYNRIISTTESTEAKKNHNYSIYSINIRSKSDNIITGYLVDALNSSKIKKFDKANKLIEEARSLAPEFYEVRLVEAWVRALQDHISLAEQAYLAAIELASESARALFFYSNFILKYLHDTKKSREYLERAYKYDRNSLIIPLDLAKINMYLKDFDQTERLLFEIEIDKLPKRSKTIYYDIYIQYCYRIGEDYFEYEEITKAVDSYIRMIELYNEVPSYLKDNTMKRTLRKSKVAINQCYSYIESKDKIELNKLKDKLLSILIEIDDILEIDKHCNCNDTNSNTGTIARIIDNTYGFIDYGKEEHIFFHRAGIAHSKDWVHLKEGSNVNFSIKKGSKGKLVAHNIAFI